MSYDLSISGCECDQGIFHKERKRDGYFFLVDFFSPAHYFPDIRFNLSSHMK